MSATPILQFQDLSYAYASKQDGQVVQGLSGAIYPGKHTVVMGPSGSGKSTLLKLLAGHLKPATGHIFLDGKPLPGPDVQLVPGHPDIALLDQLPVFTPRLTAQQALVHAMRDYERTWAQAEAIRLLELVQLGHYAHQHPSTLSGGEQQRLALVLTLCTRPRVLLLDEPLSRVDPYLRGQLALVLASLAADYEVAMLWTLHEPALALGIADELWLMNKGQWLQQGSPQTVYEQPVNLLAAHLLGEASELPDGAILRPHELDVYSLDHPVQAPAPDTLGWPGVVERVVYNGKWEVWVRLCPTGQQES